MQVASFTFACVATGCVVATGAPNAVASPKVELIEPGRYALTGPISAEDRQAVEALPREASLVVYAWGDTVEAWLAVAAISDTAEKKEMTVRLEYAEDAAIALAGLKTEYKGKLFADSPIPLDEHQRQKIRSTLERFEIIGRKAKIPKEAERQSPAGLVGYHQSFTGRKGTRDALNQVWYFTRTGDSSQGKWAYDDPEDVIKEAKSGRDAAQKKAKNQIAVAEQRRSKDASTGKPIHGEAKPAGDAPKPPPDPSKPPGDPTKPSGNPSKPSGNPSKPSGDPTKPEGGPSKPPGDQGKPPPDASKPPADPTKPSDDKSKPAPDPRK